MPAGRIRLNSAMYLPHVYLPSGETHYTWMNEPIIEKLEEGFYRVVFHHFPLMDYIEQKYLDGTMLDILCNFRDEVTKAHQEEIGIILDGASEGEIW
jgi:hypothetical protein